MKGWIGKIVGSALGLYAGGTVGAVLGILLGNAFDRTQQDHANKLKGDRRGVLQTVFFQATFRVMGKLAKADGRVSEQEIQQARDVMTRMGLDEVQRLEAMRLFNEGKTPDYDIMPLLDELHEIIGRRSTLSQLFLELQLQTAYSDGSLSPNEQRIIQLICKALNINKLQFELIHQRMRAQAQFSRSGSRGSAGRPRGPSLEQSYRVLGIDARASDADLKKAYRRLMSQHHPDKLVARGLPEEMMAIAKEKTQEIQQAYETIKNQRKLS
ncbi:co-chaperone DjlA [Saccharospirillum sp. MSK14-1]|uniref:co-chaperone DjlA n=1 Tax=Saccharospirillum sp. MSK14-1 TaxID=1897632 RepID=UPI001E30D57A|nr:co-chaperone DjlA [Saccharospirillum sp. MSK14-1]